MRLKKYLIERLREAIEINDMALVESLAKPIAKILEKPENLILCSDAVHLYKRL